MSETTAKSAMTPYQILAAARAVVCERAPYFRAGVLALVPRETPGFGSFATTKDWIMLWDPAVAVKWGVEGTAAAITHELFHLIRDHFERFSAAGTNEDVANIAGDLAINPSVCEMGFKIPSESMFPDKFGLADGLTAEQYYAELSKMKIEYRYTLGDGCGSCSGRRIAIEPDEEESNEEGRSAVDIKRVKIVIAKEIKGKNWGSMPGGLDRWADSMLAPPAIRWEEKLARVCRAATAYRPGSGYSTYSRLSRRQAGIGFGPGRPVLPSYRATRPRVTFLIDTSGSMGNDQLALAMTEAHGVLKACGAVMEVVVCDAAVRGAKTVKSIGEACKMLKGGGGSDFRPAFDKIQNTHPKASIVVAATDGYISVPPTEPPGIKVIWLLVGGGAQKPCSWGTAIQIDRVDRKEKRGIA